MAVDRPQPEQAPVTAVDPGRTAADVPGLELAALGRWLRTHHPDLLTGTLSAQLIAGGRSNLTYLVSGDGRQAVLRRPPLGHVLATAHDMTREYRVLSALAATAVPVPRPLALCPEPDVLGAPFYLMTYVPGVVARRPRDVAGLDERQRHRLARAMIDVLADLHGLDPEAVGLAGFGRPEGYLERQLRRWSAQLEASRSRPLAGIDALRDDLAATLPAAGPATGAGAARVAGAAGCILHGDYRLDNLVLAPLGRDQPPEVRAVLDWEMSTLGDPLADLGLLLAYWDGLGSLPNPVVEAIGPRAGFPPGSALAGWYAERSGAEVARLPWYVAFGFFKIAVILEGIHYRFVQGQTVGAGFDAIGPLVPALVEFGRAALPGAGPR